MRSRRALLYVPGDDEHKINKATHLGVDSVCLDLEDGVAINRKETARHVTPAALLEKDFGGSERLARINPVGSGIEAADLAAVLPARPDGIVVPKVENGGQVLWVSEQIAAFEHRQGWPAGEIALLVLVETALGLVRLEQIATASARLQAVIFGAEDLAGDIGLVRTPAAWEVFYARSAVVTHCAAFGLQAIDMVYVDFTDQAGLAAESIQAAGFGFSGKQVIHPNQVTPVQEAFTPSDADIFQANRVLEAFAGYQKAGQGAFALDGKMVDAPIIKAAERVMARARAARRI